MWINYFYQIQKKYTMRLSNNKTLVIRLDGKDVTKDQEINFLYSHKGSFLYSLKEAAKYFSKKYNCYALCGTDEISFIIEDPKSFFLDIQDDNNYYSQETISVFSQYFFDYFNNTYKNRKVFWHAKCFSIPNGKIKSYITYRSKSIKNVITTYFLKKNGIKNIGNESINKRIQMSKSYNDYNTLKDEINGNLFFQGNKIDIYEFFNGNIKVINELNFKNTNLDDEINIDIDIEI